MPKGLSEAITFHIILPFVVLHQPQTSHALAHLTPVWVCLCSQADRTVAATIFQSVFSPSEFTSHFDLIKKKAHYEWTGWNTVSRCNRSAFYDNVTMADGGAPHRVSTCHHTKAWKVQLLICFLHVFSFHVMPLESCVPCSFAVLLVFLFQPVIISPVSCV